MSGGADRRDRNEAAKLFVAVALAVALLIAMGGVALYFLVGRFEGPSPFAGGLDLKHAAVIAFGVSLAVILVMAIVSGGDAVLGELPFTILGFLVFFVIFWLMIAWIF
jgi:hypothetical protein